jgi:hypothetical protein
MVLLVTALPEMNITTTPYVLDVAPWVNFDIPRSNVFSDR